MTLLCRLYCTALYYLFTTQSGERYQHFSIWMPPAKEQEL